MVPHRLCFPSLALKTSLKSPAKDRSLPAAFADSTEPRTGSSTPMNQLHLPQEKGEGVYFKSLSSHNTSDTNQGSSPMGIND